MDLVCVTGKGFLGVRSRDWSCSPSSTAGGAEDVDGLKVCLGGITGGTVWGYGRRLVS